MLKKVFIVLSLVTSLVCFSGETEAAESYSITVQDSAVGRANGANPALKRLNARRAAIVILLNKTAKEVGAKRAALRNIISEQWDGENYTIIAEVQLYS